MAAVITNMDIPLGNAVGNALEVEEAVAVLSGKGPSDLWAVCRVLAARMLSLLYGWTVGESETRVDEAVSGGAALMKFREWIERQGGDTGFIGRPGALGISPVRFEYKAAAGGYITGMNAELIGKAASALGAGREKAGDLIDYQAGILFKRKTGDRCNSGDVIAELHTSSDALLGDACRYLDASLLFGKAAPEKQPLIFGIVD